MRSDPKRRTSIRTALPAAGLAVALLWAVAGRDAGHGYLGANRVTPGPGASTPDLPDNRVRIRPVPMGSARTTSSARPASDTGELRRVWSSSQVHVEGEEGMIFGRLGDQGVQRRLAGLHDSRPVPTAVLLHGCEQPRWWGPFRFWREVAQSGFALIALDGFARRDWRALCARNGLDRSLWDAEIRFALEQVRALPWVDHDNLFLIGFDEGGEAAGAYFGDAFNGVVVIAAGCGGYSTDAVSPLLVVASLRDAELEGRSRGCLNASDRLYIDSAVHQVLVFRDAQQAIRRFLLRHRV